MSVALSNLDDPERQFGPFRVWGTLGWIAAGWSVSLLHLDQSAMTGMIASGIRVFAGLACFFLPHTPPKGGRAMNWRAALGLDALEVLKQRDLAVYFLTAFLFSIPLAAFYMHTPRHLEDLGMTSVAAGMSWGQVSEVVALMALGYVMVRWRLKTMLLFAIACGIARYALNAVGAATESVTPILVGVVLHGLCWTFFFESGRVFVDRRVEPSQRSRTQALLSLVSGGIGGVLGTKVVGWLFRTVAEGKGAEGWTVYWWILTGLCAAAGLVFFIGYRGLPVSARVPEVPPAPTTSAKV
jgi:nucleoside transporter